ncbi:MAG: hypothetical protein AAGM38_11590 [Pseudomonadota bacterium]
MADRNGHLPEPARQTIKLAIAMLCENVLAHLDYRTELDEKINRENWVFETVYSLEDCEYQLVDAIVDELFIDISPPEEL